MDINGKVAAITGGASGLGEATVRHFLQNGAKVVILDLNDENAKKLIDELGVKVHKY
jgi:NAD(P)-dependent dehydrogenase (short-subunit alcohol dehydrogenase family)